MPFYEIWNKEHESISGACLMADDLLDALRLVRIATEQGFCQEGDYPVKILLLNEELE